jgi:hypothetical protein
MEVEEEGERAEEEEVSLGVIMINIEIKFHILLFTLSCDWRRLNERE